MKRLHTFLIQNFIGPVSDFIMPALCISCSTALPFNRKIICDACYQQLKPMSPTYVQVLKDEISPAWFDELLVCFEFEKTFQQLIHLLKYQRALTIAQYFGTSLGKIVTVQYDYVAGVPLNPVRQRERGYNQSHHIARALAGNLGLIFRDDLIVRIRDTVSQTKLNRSERKTNVRNAFRVDPAVTGKQILIIDDVITTGSTLNECARALKEKGAARADIAALATPVNFLQNNLEENVKELEIL